MFLDTRKEGVKHGNLLMKNLWELLVGRWLWSQMSSLHNIIYNAFRLIFLLWSLLRTD